MRRISFIVPVYNTPSAKLERCLASILAVDRAKSEIIVINDGSSREHCEEYEEWIRKQNDGRIRYECQNNMGVSAARNRGITLARGEYIMLVDSDDEIIADAIPDEYHGDLIFLPHVFIKGRKKILRSAISGDSGEVPFDEYSWLVVCGKVRGSCGLLYRREHLVNHGIQYEAGCIQGEDADFNFRFMMTKPVVQYIKSAAYIYHFSTETVRSRWNRLPEKMLLTGAARFEQAQAVLPQLFPEDYEKREPELFCNRISDLYRSAIELCCAGQATKDHKRKIEQMMIATPLPEDADPKVKQQHRDVVKRRWLKIGAVAKLRNIYLRITGI